MKTRRDMVLTMAEEIILMHREMEDLKQQNLHQAELLAIYQESSESSKEHNRQMTAAMLLYAIGDNDGAKKILS